MGRIWNKQENVFGREGGGGCWAVVRTTPWGSAATPHRAWSRQGRAGRHGDSQGDTGETARFSDPPAPDKGLSSLNMPPPPRKHGPWPRCLPALPAKAGIPARGSIYVPGLQARSSTHGSLGPTVPEGREPWPRSSGPGREAPEQPWMGARDREARQAVADLTLMVAGTEVWRRLDSAHHRILRRPRV